MIGQRLTFIYMLIISATAWAQCDSLIQVGDHANDAFNVRLAAHYYSQAFRLCPDNLTAAVKYGHALLDIGEESEKPQSVAFYDSALALADSLCRRFLFDAECHFLRAWAIGHVALSRSNRERILLVREYEAHLQRTLELEPDHALAHLALGIFNREVAAIPGLVRTLARLLLGELPDGTFEQALLHINEAIRYDPRSLAAVYELAKTYDMMGEKHRAVHHYQKVLCMPQADHMDGRKINSATKKLLQYQHITAQQNDASTALN